MADVKEKTIQITPELFKVKSDKSNKSKERREKRHNRPTQKSNPLKKQLMNKIKQHASKHNKTLKQNKDFTTTFEEHMDYLSTLSKRKKLKIHSSLPEELANPPKSVTNEIKPVPSTPVPATPVPATPVPATPVPATPVPSTPVPATPVPATPVSATPVPATPVPATPVPSTPVPATPVPSTPVPATPVSATPVSATPVPATPVPATPVSATPVPATPVPALVNIPSENRTEMSATIPIQNSLPPVFTKQDPPYGILKSGLKPTYRQFNNKTRKNKPRFSKPRELIQHVKKTYSLGKKGKKLSVFLKNKKTRKNTRGGESIKKRNRLMK